MADWTSYGAAKDFAGPLATVIASTVAALFAGAQICVARAQQDIAKSQAEIALDKLKFDLFEKRYEIYTTTKKLIEHISGSSLDNTNAKFIRECYVKMDESRFFFPQDIIEHLDQIAKTCTDMFELNARRNTIDVGDQENWSRIADQLANKILLLQTFYRELPEKFERDLSFQKIKQSAQGS